MLSPDAYRDELAAHLNGHMPPPQDVPLSQAHGLVLAAHVHATVPVPAWTNSAMDGYAVRAGTTASASPSHPVTLPVSADVPAGLAPRPLQPGTAARIMTGAALPPGADAVVKVEDTDQAPGPHPLPAQVRIRVPARPGGNVRRAGEDVQAGERVLSAGTRLSARAVSAAAAAGCASLLVRPRPRVAVISTGAELVDPGQPLAPGQIPDSNGLLLAGLATEAGAQVVSVARAGDSVASLRQALADAASQADLIITSGGVSAGAFDPLRMLAQADDAAGSGTCLTFRKVAMQPGKPQGYGHVPSPDGRRVPLVMLPGNPVSVFVSFLALVRPAAGLAAAVPEPGTARAACSWRSPAGRRQYVPVRYHRGEDEGVWVEPCHRLGSGSHAVAALAAAEAVAVVPARTDEVHRGDILTLITL